MRRPLIAALLFTALVGDSPVLSSVSTPLISRGAVTDGGTMSREAVARAIAEARDISEVQFAPNGAHVAYTIARGSVERNSYTTELYVASLARDGRAQGTPRLVATQARDTYAHLGFYFVPRWCPDSTCLSYFSDGSGKGTPAGLVRYDLETGRASAIDIRDTGAPSRPRITKIGTDYRWSPSGTEIAFSAQVASTDLDPRRGVNVTVDWAKPMGRRALMILDVATGSVTQLTPDSVDTTRGFSWAPNGAAVVFAAASGPWAPGRRADLFVVDRATRAIRSVVSEKTGSDYPSWSPDGRWVSFRTLGSPTRLAVVPATGGPVVYLTRANDAPVGVYASSLEILATWSPDSRSILFGLRDRLNNRVFRATLPSSGASTAPSPTLALEDSLAYDADFSVSSETEAIAFTRQVDAGPAVLYVSPPTQGERFNPSPLTEPDSAFPLQNTTKVERISWRSADGQSVLEGVLLTPRAAWQGDRVKQPLPTLVCLKDDNSDVELGNAPTQRAAVARGYAVLIPSQRGRTGSGEEFRREQGRNYFREPMDDTLVALDSLVKQGIVDGTKLGVYGFSQGGTRAAGLVTMTNRFKAAVIREAHIADLVHPQFFAAASPNWQRSISERQGGGDIYDPNERARIEGESPIHNIHRVKTPTLLLFGAYSYGPTVGRMLFNGLQRFDVPSEFVVYDEGHTIVRPAAMVDYVSRTLGWFDYWLLDQPYPDAVRQREYDGWKKHTDATR